MVLLLSLAWADLIRPQPITCLPGSYERSNHSGTWCAPSFCSSTEDCKRGDCVAEVGLCLVETEEACRGKNPNCTFTKTKVVGACSTQDDCEAGDCKVSKRCMQPVVAPSPADEPPPPEVPPPVTPVTETTSCGFGSGLSSWMTGLLGVFVLLMGRVR